MFQSTHPRGVRRKDHHRRDHRQPVSIHAPAWGATRSARSVAGSSWVSIHAPAWGATVGGAALFCTPRCFNPRTRVGCDQMLLSKARRDDSVSIHAPAWGATAAGQCRWGRWRCFNPRTRVGCDRASCCIWPSCSRFQSTHPRGVRRRADYSYFCRATVSIHAPAWGATVSMFYPVDSRD